NLPNVTLTWNGISDAGAGISYVRYYVGGLPWTSTGSAAGAGSCSINTSSWSNGTHTVILQGVDKNGNLGATRSASYYKDTTPPLVGIATPVQNAAVSGNVNVSFTAKRNDAYSAFSSWKLECGYGTSPAKYTLLANGTDEKTNFSHTWNTDGLVEGGMYTLRLTATDAAGNSAATTRTVLIAKNTDMIAPALQIDSPAAYTPDGCNPKDADSESINQASQPVIYQRINNGGLVGLTNGKLYANNKIAGTQTTASQGFQLNAAAWNDATGWVYPEGSLVFLYVNAKDSTGDLYSTSTYQTQEIEDTINSISDIVNASNIAVGTNGAQLTQGSTTGVFESLNREFAGDVCYIDLKTMQEVPAGAGIAYQVSVDGGGTWQNITPISTDGGITNAMANRKYFTDAPAGSDVKLRATLNKGTATFSPTVKMMVASVRYTTYANAVLVAYAREKVVWGR
ncbi:MAG: hypothetical protein RR193_05155, partial [Christensenellaceae bacterium]